MLVGDPAALPADAAAGARARAPGRRSDLALASRRRSTRPTSSIDALLGIGASRAAGGRHGGGDRARRQPRRSRRPVLAVDVPSGLDADTGQPLGDACVVARAHAGADRRSSRACSRPSGRDHAGAVWLDALGLDLDAAGARRLAGRRAARSSATTRRAATPQHKGSFGDVAVVGGAAGMTGAALLAARAAHAAGAGRVFVDLLDAGAAALALDPERPELMFRPGWWQGAAAAIEPSTVVCGCGGGDAVRAALPRLRRPRAAAGARCRCAQRDRRRHGACRRC